MKKFYLCTEIVDNAELAKSHISSYTRADGTVVQEHEDSRQKLSPYERIKQTVKAVNKLRKVSEKHKYSDAVAYKPGTIAEVDSLPGIPASELKGSEIRHFDHDEVYHAPHIGTLPRVDGFREEFYEKERKSGREPFVLRHNNGKRYLVLSHGFIPHEMAPINESK